MPELPDVLTYVDSLERLLVGRPIGRILVRSPFVVRTFDPDLLSCEGRAVVGMRRIGKRIVWELDELFIVFHLMIAGRFHWRTSKTRPSRKVDLAAFQFEHGTMLLTEAASKKRASIHVIRDEHALDDFDRGGLEVLDCTLDEFAERLRTENHTLKRSLTDPRLFSGIGNAYSDEILHAAQLSPIKHSTRLTDEEVAALFEATQSVLRAWSERLIAESAEKFPEKVTAFRPGMAAHGKFGEPCPVCQSPIQRIVYAENETNYCPTCQTDGKVLKDRALSRLLKEDWPRTVEELEDGA